MKENEIEKIRKMKIDKAEWDTSQFQYMSNSQIIEVHRSVYNDLIKGLKKLRGGVSILY